MAIEMINQWFGIERMGVRFLVRDLAGVHANCATRAEAVAWIEAAMSRIDSMDEDEPEATADEYRDASAAELREANMWEADERMWRLSKKRQWEGG